MTIQELIQQQMDHFVGLLAAKSKLQHTNVVDLAAHVSAYLIRTRHVQNQGISQDEMEGLMQAVINYLNDSFHGQFTSEDFIQLRNEILELLKDPGFDQNIQSYFAHYYQ